MNVLLEIMGKKRERVAGAKEIVSPEQISRFAAEVRSKATPHAFINALRADGINIIAEFNKGQFALLKAIGRHPLPPSTNELSGSLK